jgi:small-conductance mechanosensitive channel
MSHLINSLQRDFMNPNTLIGAVFYGLLFLVLAIAIGTIVRKFSKRLESNLTDVTGLRFASLFVQVIVFLIAFILYAHIIPELRSLGTTILAGVSVISVVLGLAAQNTLSNLIAGVSLVLYRPISVGDSVQINTPKGVQTATVEVVSLGYTILRDKEANEIIIPNSVMISTIVIRVSERDS